jgi:hypothetical protein
MRTTMTEKRTDDLQAQSEQAKPTYHKPELVELGNVIDLTCGSKSRPADGGPGGKA